MDHTAVWKNLYEPLHRFVLRRVKQEDVADDIVQEVFLRLQLYVSKLRDPGKLDQWLYQVARNAINDHFRQNKRQQDLQVAPMASSDDTDENLNHQLVEWLPHAIELLPEKYREALRLTEIEGLSQKELAERLDISYSGAKSRVQRGREKLKEVILQCCEVQTDRYGNVLHYQSRQVEEKKEDCCD